MVKFLLRKACDLCHVKYKPFRVGRSFGQIDMLSKSLITSSNTHAIHIVTKRATSMILISSDVFCSWTDNLNRPEQWALEKCKLLGQKYIQQNLLHSSNLLTIIAFIKINVWFRRLELRKLVQITAVPVRKCKWLLWDKTRLIHSA